MFPRQKSPVSGKLQQWIRRFPIRRRLLWLFLVQIILVGVWCNSIVLSTVNEYAAAVHANNAQILYTVDSEMNALIRSLDSVTRYPIIRTGGENSYLYQYLCDTDNYQFVGAYQYYTDVQDQFLRLHGLYPGLSAITIYDGEGNGVYLGESDVRYSISYGGGPRSWFQQAEERRGSFVLLDAHAAGDADFPVSESALCAARAIIRPEKWAVVGYMFASAEAGHLESYFQNIRMSGQQRMGVYSLEGQRYAGDLDEQAFEMLCSSFSSTPGEEIRTLALSRDGKRHIYSYTVAPRGYVCVVETPSSYIWSNALQKQQNLFAMLLLLLLLVLLLSNRVVSSVTTPIARLVEACERIKTGDFSHLPQDASRDELSSFTQSFNSMIGEINTLIHEVYEKEAIRSRTEIQMLRAQINPHFLYNTLEGIRISALQAGAQDSGEMAALLAEILRYGVSDPSELVAVREELENLEDYIRLQKLRLGGSVHFSLSVDPRMLGCKVIRLLLQPLMENAINHGVSTLESGGTVEVLGVYGEGQLEFHIVDNGVGISPMVLRDLNDYIEDRNGKFNSIGIKNVHRRIRLTYGEHYGVHVRSTLGRGTMVTVTLPNCTAPEQGKDDTHAADIGG